MMRTGLTPLADWALTRCGATIHSQAVCMRRPGHPGEHDKRISPKTLRKLTEKSMNDTTTETP